jgi:hypothetical protein
MRAAARPRIKPEAMLRLKTLCGHSVFLANRGHARYQVRALPAYAGRCVRSAAIAQLVEHVIRNDGVTGSSPVCGTSDFNHLVKSRRSTAKHRVCTVSANQLPGSGPGPWGAVGRAFLIILCSAAIVGLLVSAPPPPKYIEIGSMPIGGDCRRWGLAARRRPWKDAHLTSNASVTETIFPGARSRSETDWS